MHWLLLTVEDPASLNTVPAEVRWTGESGPDLSERPTRSTVAYLHTVERQEGHVGAGAHVSRTKYTDRVHRRQPYLRLALVLIRI